MPLTPSESLWNQMIDPTKPLGEQKTPLSPSGNAIGDFLKQSEAQPSGFVDRMRQSVSNFLFPPSLNDTVGTSPLEGGTIPGIEPKKVQTTNDTLQTPGITGFGQQQTTAPAEPRWWESAGNWTKEAAGNVGSWISDTYSSLTGTPDAATQGTPSAPLTNEESTGARTLPLAPNFDNYVGPNTASEDIPVKSNGSDQKTPLEVYREDIARLEPRLNEMQPTLDARRAAVEKYDAEMQQFIRDKVVSIEPGKEGDTYVFKPADLAEFKQLQESKDRAYESYKSVADEYKPLAEKYSNLFNGYKDLQAQDPVAAAVDSIRQANQAEQAIISNAEKQVAAAAENGNLPASDPRAYESLLKELSTRGDAALLDKSPEQVIADARARRQ